MLDEPLTDTDAAALADLARRFTRAGAGRWTLASIAKAADVLTWIHAPVEPEPETPRRTVSAETRERMRRAQAGRKFTAEHRAKLSAAHAGKPLSPEHRAAIKRGLARTRNPEARYAR